MFPKITVADNFFPVEDDDSENGRKLNNNIEAFGELGCRNMEKVLGDDEVTGARNREELGETFDKGENNGLEISHEFIILRTVWCNMNLMWFLKKNEKKKVGLVLGSGGARGLAHIGVIKVLLKNKIPIDIIVGASSGALIGGFYAAWGDIEKIEELVREVTYKEMASVLVDPDWGGALIKGGKTIEFLRKHFQDKKIEDLNIPYAAVATDLKTAETVVFDKGDLTTAVRASISVPLIYSPVVFEGEMLVDGGVSSPVPVEVARRMGAEIVVAVNLDGVYFQGKKNDKKYLGTTVDILKDSYFALRYNLAKKEVQQADVVIEPEMTYVQDFDFVAGKDAISAGEAATEKLMEKIKELL